MKFEIMAGAWNVLRKIILIPAIAVLTLIEWCGTFLTGLLSIVAYLVAGLLLLVTIASYLLGLFTGMVALRNIAILLAAVVGCNLPTFAIGVIGAARTALIEYL